MSELELELIPDDATPEEKKRIEAENNKKLAQYKAAKNSVDNQPQT